MCVCVWGGVTCVCVCVCVCGDGMQQASRFVPASAEPHSTVVLAQVRGCVLQQI